MKKLYDKSEITFAIVWIVIYTVGMGTLQNNFGLDSIGVGYGFADSKEELTDAGCTYYAETVEDLAKLLLDNED